VPDFVYVGDEGRYYALPAPACSPVVGETYDLPEAPQDGRWTPAETRAKARAAAKPDQPADPAPAGDTTTNQE